MNNLMTDQLRTAEKKVISTFWPFSQQLQPSMNYHQIVFRAGGYFDTLPAGNVPTRVLRVIDRDIVIQVYTQPRLYSMTGTVRTRDKYRRIYDAQLIVEAADPQKVANAYIHEKDPVGYALDTVKRAFEEEATNFNHDYIHIHSWPFETWSTQIAADVGIRIKLFDKAMFRVDPAYAERAQALAEMHLRAEKFRLEQAIQEEQELARRASEAAAKEAERKGKEQQSDFERREKTKDQLYQICYELRQVAADDIKEALHARIQESFACGFTPSQISGEYFALLGIFQDTMHVTIDRWIVSGEYVNGDLGHNISDQEEPEDDLE